jgi:hypothetical protein
MKGSLVIDLGQQYRLDLYPRRTIMLPMCRGLIEAPGNLAPL